MLDNFDGTTLARVIGPAARVAAPSPKTAASPEAMKIELSANEPDSLCDDSKLWR